VGSLPCTLKFVVKDVDPASGLPDDDDQGYDDEYKLEDLEIAAADFMRRVAVVDFRTAWETMGNGGEVVETFSLSYSSIKAAMDALVEFLGMQVCENSGQPAESSRATVTLSGVFLGGMQVFAIVNLRTDSPTHVGMRLTVRSADVGISQFVAASVA
jgi:coatomer protein complex subunit gamma